MDLIFTNGSKLYSKQIEKQSRILKFIKDAEGLKSYQEALLYEANQKSKRSYNIYGDDFKVEIIPNNMVGDCALSIKDYDEYQKLENETNVSFNKEELNQFINLLQIIESKIQ